MSYPNQALPREFRMAGGGFGKMVLPYVFLLVFFAAVMLLLGSVFGGIVGGIIAAVVGTAALVGVLWSKFNRMRQGTVVRFSEYGVELSDTLGYQIRLNWPDITRIGEVKSHMSNPTAAGARDHPTGFEIALCPNDVRPDTLKCPHTSLVAPLHE